MITVRTFKSNLPHRSSSLGIPSNAWEGSAKGIFIKELPRHLNQAPLRAARSAQGRSPPASRHKGRTGTQGPLIPPGSAGNPPGKPLRRFGGWNSLPHTPPPQEAPRGLPRARPVTEGSSEGSAVTEGSSALLFPPTAASPGPPRPCARAGG